MFDGRILARRVHRLEHDEECVAVARPQQLLHVRELVGAARQELLCGRIELGRGQLLEFATASPFGVASGQVRR